MRRIEAAIVRLPPPAALAVLLLPTLGLLPVKLAALWLLARDEAMAGLAVVVVAKLVGTAVLAWVFALTRPALIHMPWFAAVYEPWYAWKESLLAWVRASWAWRTGRAVKGRLRRWVARWRGGAVAACMRSRLREEIVAERLAAQHRERAEKREA